ncbi:DNA polymerase kappa subunit [Schistosoma japonicum]|uniref:DNA polymerase kappa n=1 Tax=Schistosoma japonicum TaxID=6182 RepID=A0A4Z2DNW2_SCHJA|nr:DNA polymerase kappa subunit [Schistosoma japonicum]
MGNNNDDENFANNLEGCCRYSTSKAGMDGLDKATIMEIILENSKGSKFYENELRRERTLRQQIEQKLKIIKSLTPAMLQNGEVEADNILKNLKPKRCFSRSIVHVDMDAFYAAVEIRDQPELRHHPVAVGSNSMLSTSNYIARRFGVRAGLPGFLGKKLCPQLKIIPCDFVKYTATSRVVRSVLMDYASSGKVQDLNESDSIPFSAVSLDEAYLDLTDHLIERCDFNIERRTFWPRPAPGAPMLVCRCPSRSKDPQSHNLNNDSSSSTDDQPVVSIDDITQSNSNSCQQNSKSSVKPKYYDPELAVCDECGLLCKSGRRIFGITAWEAVREMRFRIFCATRLTCSAGIGPNTLIAKIASDWIKPCGQYEILNTLEAVDKFMQTMPVRKVPGIGYVTERRLDAFGIKMCGDLIEKRGLLWHVSTRTTMVYYMRIALGHSDDRWLINAKNYFDEKFNKSFGITDGDIESSSCAPPIQGQVELNRKSMSVERTFSDTCDETELFQRCEQLAQMLSTDLKEEHVKGQLITLKMKLDTFEVRTRSQLLPDYTSHADIINSFGRELLREEMSSSKSNPLINKPLTLRLMGLRMSNLLPAEMCPQIRQRSVEEAFMFAITNNNGNNYLSPEKSDLISKAQLHTLPSIQSNKSHNIIPSSPKSSVQSVKRGMKLSTKSHQKKNKKKRILCNSVPVSSSLLTQWANASLLNTSDEAAGSSSVTISSDLSPGHLSSSSSSVSFCNNNGYSSFTCPVCEKSFQFYSEDKFNYHLDECLNRSAILEVVKETFTQPTEGEYCSTTSQPTNLIRKAISSNSINLRKPKLQKVENKEAGNNTISSTSHGPLDKFIFNPITVQLNQVDE